MTAPTTRPVPPPPPSGAGPRPAGVTPAPQPARRANGAVVEDRFYRHLVHSMRNGVLAITRDGRLATMNEVAYRVLGVTPGPDDIGAPFSRVLRTEPDIVRLLASAFELGSLPSRAELRLKRSGKVIGYTLSHIHDGRGRTSGAALFFKDLTRVEQLEERERLRDRLATLGEMAAAIAHEVKNPLAGIEVMAGLLRRKLPESHDAQALLNDIIGEAKVANAIVLEVLEFVRPIRLQVDRFPVRPVLQEALGQAERKSTRGDVTVTLNASHDLPLVHGDAHQLGQLVTNLLINAFEALEGRGAMTVAAWAGTEDAEQAGLPEDHGPVPTVVIEVSDNGPGVPPEIVDRIFNPFFTTKPQGSGLGLAIVRKVVDAHNGRIDVRSAPDGGTIFRVTLPTVNGDDWLRET